ncbi:MAG TPA: SDR family oxidoreductase [Dehalococcoidia bacterium]
MEISGKVAVVTGGGSGIGRATARRLAREGAKVLVADLDAEGGRETVRLIQEAGGQAAFLQVDVTREEDVRRMVRRAEETYGGLDILHNNAGITTGWPRFPEAEPARWGRVLDVNLRAVILGTQVAVEAMRRRGGGVIVNTASIAGLQPFPPDPVYTATKHGVVGFTRALAPLKEEAGIRVNCVCPGVVDTPLVTRTRDQVPPELRAPARAFQLEMLSPDDIADAVVELITNEGLAGAALRVPNNGPRELV